MDLLPYSVIENWSRLSIFNARLSIITSQLGWAFRWPVVSLWRHWPVIGHYLKGICIISSKMSYVWMLNVPNKLYLSETTQNYLVGVHIQCFMRDWKCWTMLKIYILNTYFLSTLNARNEKLAVTPRSLRICSFSWV